MNLSTRWRERRSLLTFYYDWWPTFTNILSPSIPIDKQVVKLIVGAYIIFRHGRIRPSARPPLLVEGRGPSCLLISHFGWNLITIRPWIFPRKCSFWSSLCCEKAGISGLSTSVYLCINTQDRHTKRHNIHNERNRAGNHDRSQAGVRCQSSLQNLWMSNFIYTVKW